MSEHAAAEAAGLQQPLSWSALLCLLDFWPYTPQVWFIFTESRFPVKCVLSEPDRLDLVVSSLPESLPQVIDVPESPEDALVVEGKSIKMPGGNIQESI
jgi:hypothetical protein